MTSALGELSGRPRVLDSRPGSPRLLATVGSRGLSGHASHWGGRPQVGPALIDEIRRSGLVGRGGAGFPTAAKWDAVLRGKPPVVVVANGTEGEPASNKDKVLLLHATHLVLDGLVLAAEALGAGEAILCVDSRSRAALEAAWSAIAERSSAGMDPLPIRVEATPGGYLSGEESSLVSWINGGPAKPTIGHRPFVKGVGGRPTLVNNVETLAHVAMIARFGSTWYRRSGTPDSPGTTLVTITGDVAHPAVYEIPLGTTLGRAVAPASPLSDPQAFLVGGYFGTWISAAMASTGVDHESLRRIGSSVGCGAIVVAGRDSCGLKAAAAITRWLAGQSAGQCGPCVNGLPAIAGAMDQLVAGKASRRALDLLHRWAAMVEGRGACKHPDGTARMVRSAISTFADEIDRHARSGPCGLHPTKVATPRT